jgi:antitoxin VapB
VAGIPGRRVKLYKDGRIRQCGSSREFEFPGENAMMRKEGDRLVIELSPPKSLVAALAALAEDFPPIGNLPPVPVYL